MDFPMRLKRFFTAFVSVTFMVSGLVAPGPRAFAATPELPQGTPEHQSFRLPPELGIITPVSPVLGAKRLVIHIEEAHGNYSAQRNIRDILKFLNTQYGIKQVFVEGAGYELRPVSLSPSEGDTAVRDTVSDRLMRTGLLTGVEAFLMEPGHDMKGYGVEEASSYREDLNAYRSVYRARKITDDFLERALVNWKLRADRDIGKDLREFLLKEILHQEGKFSLPDWLSLLAEAARKSLKSGEGTLDLSDLRSQVEWPTLVRYFRLRSIEGRIDPVKLETEKKDFLLHVESKLHALNPREGSSAPIGNPDLFNELREILAAHPRDEYPPYETRAAFERLLDVLPEEVSFDRFPNLRLEIQRIILVSEMPSDRLRQEMQELTSHIAGALARTEQEKALVRALANYGFLKKTFALELSREEFLDLRERDFSLRKWAEGLGFDPIEISAAEKAYRSAVRFYEGAIRREDVMIKNSLARLALGTDDSAVLVTGGFHTTGLKEKLLASGTSYVRITPRISEIGPGDRKNYLFALLGGEEISRSQQAPLCRSETRFVAEVLPASEARAYFSEYAEAIRNALPETARGKQDPVAGARSESRSENREKFPFDLSTSVTWTKIMNALDWIAQTSDPAAYEREIRHITMLVVDRADNMKLNEKRDYDQYPEDLPKRVREVSVELLSRKISSLKMLLEELITALPYAFAQGAANLHSVLWGIAADMDERTLRTKFARELREALHGPTLSKQDLYLVRTYRLFLETGKATDSVLDQRRIILQREDHEQRILTQRFRNDKKSFSEPQIYHEIKQIEEVMTVLFEGTSRRDIFRQWMKQPIVDKYPEIRQGLKGILKVRAPGLTLDKLPPMERYQNSKERLLWVAKTRGVIGKILIDPGTPADDMYDLYHLDRSLGETLSLVLADVLGSWDDPSLNTILAIEESADFLALMLNGLFLTGFIGRYTAQWAQLLADPELTLSQLADILRALNRDVATDYNEWQKLYYDEGHEVFDGDLERIERVLARLRRERFATRAIISLTEEMKNLVDREIETVPDQLVRPDAAAQVRALRRSDPYGEIVHFDDFRGASVVDMPRGRMLYGGKANYLIQMRALDLSVPSGFVIPYYVGNENIHISEESGFRRTVAKNIQKLETEWSARTGIPCRFGGATAVQDVEPLFLSIRSGSVFIMPGVFETAVAVGFTRDNLKRLVLKRGERAAYSAYLNFIESMAMGLGVPREKAEEVIKKFFKKHGARSPSELNAEALKLLTEEITNLLKEEKVLGEYENLLENPSQQLFLLIDTIFKSWNSPKAKRYRKEKKYSEDWYTPVTIQAYVFGDADESSGTGIVRTHDLVTGSRKLSGDWNPMTEGFYHVQGRVNPLSVEKDLKASLPSAFEALERQAFILTEHFGGPQLVEYTVQNGAVWLLQTQYDHASKTETAFPDADYGGAVEAATGNTVYGMGAFRGLVVFSSGDILVASVAQALRKNPDLDGIILVKDFITPEDSPELINAKGVLESFGKNVAILTSRGGVTSHAAVVANIEKMPAIVGAESLDLRDIEGETGVFFQGDEEPFRKLGILTLDLNEGKIYKGSFPQRGSTESPSSEPGESPRQEVRSELRLAAPEPSGLVSQPVEMTLDAFLKANLLRNGGSEKSIRRVMMEVMDGVAPLLAHALNAVKDVVRMLLSTERTQQQLNFAEKQHFVASLKMLGIKTVQAGDAFIVGHELMQQGFLAAVRSVLGDNPVAVIVRHEEDVGVVEQLNAQLPEDQKILITRDSTSEIAEATRLLKSRVGGGRVNLQVLLYGGETLVTGIPDDVVRRITRQMFLNFLAAAGQSISDRVNQMADQFRAVSRAA